jgi:hypothetical protein
MSCWDRYLRYYAGETHVDLYVNAHIFFRISVEGFSCCYKRTQGRTDRHAEVKYVHFFQPLSTGRIKYYVPCSLVTSSKRGRDSIAIC